MKTKTAFLVTFISFVLICAAAVFIGLSFFKLSSELTEIKEDGAPSSSAAALAPQNATTDVKGQAQEEQPQQAAKKAEPGNEEVKEKAQGRRTGENYEALYSELQQKYDNVSKDRENLLAQVKELIKERNKARELEAAAEETKKEKEAFLAKESELTNEKSALQEELKAMQEKYDNTVKEQDKLQDSLKEAREVTGLQKLEGDNIALLKENEDLKRNVKQIRTDYASSKDTEVGLKVIVEEMKKQVSELNNRNDELTNRNRDLEQRLVNTPKKFAEITRQNNMLIKETASMHYNLGVFYMQNKEFDRALKEFSQAVELRPDDSDSHFNIGYIYSEHALDRKKAINHFQEFLRLTKDKGERVDWARNYILVWETWQGQKEVK